MFWQESAQDITSFSQAQLVRKHNHIIYGNLYPFVRPGTGKSVLLKAIIKQLREDFDDYDSAVAVTASTGIAAINIGGSTLHSFAGVGLGKEPKKMLVRKVKNSRWTKLRWKETRTLVIDESQCHRKIYTEAR